jgi:hypothetical protein
MRIGQGVFLLAWLAGWAAGEWFAVRVLIWIVAGGTDSPAARSLAHPMGWLVGGFLLVWVVFWTIGGLAAAVELLRLVAGRDRLIAGSGGWTVYRGIGPFGRTRRFSDHEVRDVFISRSGGWLMLDTVQGDVAVTAFGKPEERRAIADQYSQRATALEELPCGWTAEALPDGRTSLRRSRIESPGCLLFVLLFASFAAAFAWLFRLQLPAWAVGAAATTAVLLGLLFFWGLISRREWLVRRDEIVMVTRFGQWRRERRVDNGSVHVERTVDSDGDESYSLRGTSGGRPVVLLRELNDDRTVLRLARAIEKASGWSVRRDFQD